MRKGWVEFTLDEVTECSWGNTETTKSKYVDAGYLAYSASGADGFLEWFEHDRTAVVLSAIGAQCGKSWFAEGKWTSIKNTIWLKSDNSNLLDKYLYYLSNRDQFWQIRGQAQPFISLGDVKKTKVSVPPLPEQKRIVDLISSVDSYIEALQQQLESAKKSRNAVLHEMLSEGGEGWTETTLGEVAKLEMGRTPSRSNPKFWTEDLRNPFCTIADMESKYVDPSREGVTLEAINSGKAKLAKKGTLLMSFKLTIGRMGFAQRDLYPNEAIVMIEPNSLKISKDYLYNYLGQKDLSAGTGKAIKGATLNSKSLASIDLLLPPLTEQKRIVDLISSMDDGISATEKLISETKQLRSGLLSDLLSGEHEIPVSYDKVIGAA